jgi:hypothetical protein
LYKNRIVNGGGVMILSVRGKNYNSDEIKVITDPVSARKDEPYKYLYVFDLKDMPFRDILGGVYPILLEWNGTELCNSGFQVRNILNT